MNNKTDVYDTLIIGAGFAGLGTAIKLREAGVPAQDLYYSRPSHITLVATLSRPLRHLAPVLDQVVGFIAHTPTQ